MSALRSMSGVLMTHRGAAITFGGRGFDWNPSAGEQPPGVLTFTRASEQRVFNGTGYQTFAAGVPAIITGTDKGYYPEPLRENMQLFSSMFADLGTSLQGWDMAVDGAVITAAEAMDPIGLAPYSIATGATLNAHAIFSRAAAAVAGGNYVISSIAKDVDHHFIILRGGDPSPYKMAVANLQTGLITASNGTLARATHINNGWYLIEHGWSPAGNHSSPSTVFGLNTNGTNLGSTLPASFTGANTSVRLGHMQVERTDDDTGAVGTTPIPTSGAAATRAATQLTGYLTPGRFTIALAFQVPTVIPAGKYVCPLNVGTLGLVRVDENGLVSVNAGNTMSFPGDERGNSVSLALSFDGTNITASKNGITPTSIVASASPVSQLLEIGHQATTRQTRAFVHRVTVMNMATP